jgi:hypothetical protein
MVKQTIYPHGSKKFRLLHANALWGKATKITVANNSYDILTEFPSISEAKIRIQALLCSTSENQMKSLKLNHPMIYYSRILSNVVTRSVTEEFHTTLQNYVSRELSTDAPLLLWLIMTHFHTSTITYQENLRAVIQNWSLTKGHNGDTQTYLIWVHHQLDILQSTDIPTMDKLIKLIEPSFQELLSTTCSRLCHEIEDWHLQYNTGGLSLTPLSLVDNADKILKALKVTKQHRPTGDPNIIALQEQVRQQGE